MAKPTPNGTPWGTIPNTAQSSDITSDERAIVAGAISDRPQMVGNNHSLPRECFSEYDRNRGQGCCAIGTSWAVRKCYIYIYIHAWMMAIGCYRYNEKTSINLNQFQVVLHCWAYLGLDWFTICDLPTVTPSADWCPAQLSPLNRFAALHDMCFHFHFVLSIITWQSFLVPAVRICAQETTC